jgi:hypothetical protein
MQVIHEQYIFEHKTSSLIDMLENTPDTLKEIKKRKKLTKAQQYKEERQKLILELEKIMGLTDCNRGILLYNLEHNEKLKEYLKEQIANIKKFYKCGMWNYFVNQHTKEGDRISEISLLKAIFKDDGYEIISKRKKMLNKNGENKQQTMIFFFLNIDINKYFKTT